MSTRSAFGPATLCVLVACVGGLPASRGSNIEDAAAKMVTEILHDHAEFRDFAFDFIVAKIDDLQLGLQRGLWRKDALGELELSDSSGKSPVFGLLTVGGESSAKLRLPSRIHRRVVAITGIKDAPDQARNITFTWSFEDAPAWLRKDVFNGKAVLRKNQFGGWDVSELQTVLSDAKGNVLLVASLPR